MYAFTGLYKRHIWSETALAAQPSYKDKHWFPLSSSVSLGIRALGYKPYFIVQYSENNFAAQISLCLKSLDYKKNHKKQILLWNKYIHLVLFDKWRCLNCKRSCLVNVVRTLQQKLSSKRPNLGSRLMLLLKIKLINWLCCKSKLTYQNSGQNEWPAECKQSWHCSKHSSRTAWTRQTPTPYIF